MSRIGIIADTHDRLDKVNEAVALFNRLRPDRVVHCGDVVAPFVLRAMGGLNSPVVAVYGNCDGDKPALRRQAEARGFRLHEGPVDFEAGGRHIVVTHRPLIPAPECDFYLHGHTHRLRHEGKRPVIVNPGEACGRLSGRATAALLDTETTEVEFFDL